MYPETLFVLLHSGTKTAEETLCLGSAAALLDLLHALPCISPAFLLVGCRFQLLHFLSAYVLSASADLLK